MGLPCTVPSTKQKQHLELGSLVLSPVLTPLQVPAQAREEMRKPIHGLAASNRIALLRTVRVQADGRHKCRLKVLFQKRRGVRDFVSSRMCFAPERVDGPEVEIAALGEVVVHGIDDRLSLSIKSTRKSCKTSPRS